MPTLSRIEFCCYRFPLTTPLETVLGPVADRHVLIVRVEDAEGAAGYGEIWCNFPAAGMEYRANLAAAIAPGVLAGMDSDAPENAFAEIRSRLHRLALQAGEPGPADQISAGLDIALHDVAARRRNQSIAAYLGSGLRPLKAYASGIGPPNSTELIQEALNAGYRAFKLRIGFGAELDLGMIENARQMISDQNTLMVDANQRWSLKTALDMASRLEPYAISWLEEPIAADRPIAEWKELAANSSIPIAAGENIRTRDQYEQVMESGCVDILQPDVCKWGGVSGCLDLARSILAAGRRYCPHYLGGGVGLAASAQVLAAAGGDGLLELDVNTNPLRDILAGPLLPLRNGMVQIPTGAGLGYLPDMEAVREYRVAHHEVKLQL